MKQEKERRKWNSEKLRLFQSLLLTIGMAVLLIWVSLAWFVSQSNIATLVNVVDPAEISIRGPHGETMTALDLSYTNDDKADDGTVTIRRVISIKSSAAYHQLEIVHTTNMKGLTFKLYAAKEANGSDGTTDSTGGSITESNYAYTYNKNDPISGTYLNVGTESNNYRFASNAYHDINYGSYSKVQIHAEPVYWLANGNLAATTKTNTNDTTEETLTYYVLEISWKEDTKETDMFYLLARNVQ